MPLAAMREREQSENSTPDDLTHNEMCVLYRESADSIRFAKLQQWRSLGAALVAFAALMTVGHYNVDSRVFMSALVLISILLGIGVIYMLVIYQNWQNTEREKLRYRADRMSATTRAVRSIKSHQEANLFRYLLLGFMILTTLIGTAIALGHLTRMMS